MLSMQKVHFTLFNNNGALAYTLSHFRWMAYQIRPDKLTKRGLLLENMVTDKDRKKNWHFNIMVNRKPKCRNVFENVHRPSKRQNILNSIFIKNITDVISTGGVAPDIIGYGIEITGVKISPCCKICNVFWQIPVRSNDTSVEIAEKLSAAGPKIRAELISRNVMGRVPMIYFLRDGTNAKIAAFEEAIQKLEIPSNVEPSIIPDDAFLKDIYKFRVNKVQKGKGSVTEVKTEMKTEVKTEEKVYQGVPQNPLDMKSDIFGLDHHMMMEKVIACKKIIKEPQQSAVITPQMLAEGDLFSKIPGICFQPDTTRETVLKNFQIERKKLMQRKCSKISKEDFQNPEENYADDEQDQNLFGDDFVEEDYTDDSKL